MIRTLLLMATLERGKLPKIIKELAHFDDYVYVEKLQPVQQTAREVFNLAHTKEKVAIVFWTPVIPTIMKELGITAERAFIYENGFVELIASDPVQGMLDRLEADMRGDFIWF